MESGNSGSGIDFANYNNWRSTNKTFAPVEVGKSMVSPYSIVYCMPFFDAFISKLLCSYSKIVERMLFAATETPDEVS